MRNILGWIFLVVFLLKTTSWAYFVGSGVKLIFYWREHLFISFVFLFNLSAAISGSLTVENRNVSSANNLGIHWRLSYKSLMGSWGAPALILAKDKLWLLRIIFVFYLLRNLLKRLNKYPEIPLRLNLWIIPSCHTLSKAFEISRNTPLTS